MTIAIAAARGTVRYAGLIMIVLGLTFWTGHLLALISLHMVLGLVFVVALWTLAALAARAGVAPGFVAVAFFWGLLVLGLGMTQNTLLPGSAHWTIQLLHLLVGMAAIGIGEGLYRRISQLHGGSLARA
ncbi:MAG: hypothetical protein ACXVAM_09135 [Vulcanimicrobiaceae bacterium]